jgi:meso-butanediol dehydrogenase/(S,S)-butanediol dehydrogenase/diacetyl reductase
MDSREMSIVCRVGARRVSMPVFEVHANGALGQLQGRIAVVTGSASGIGRASAELFAAAGAAIVAVDRDQASNEALVDSLRRDGAQAEAHTVDLGDREALVAAARVVGERHPRIDVLFNNAGAFAPSAVHAATDEHWEQMIGVNLRSAFLLIRELLPSLRRAGAASVINNASVDGLFGHPAAPVYSVAKGGLLTMARAMAYELGADGIRINSIAPGGISTPMADLISEPVRAEVTRVTPLRRLGAPREVAQVALFLASDAASFITGEVLVVDGGRNALTGGALGPPTV